DFGALSTRISYVLTDRCGQSTVSGDSILTFTGPHVDFGSDQRVAVCPGGTATFAVTIDPPGTYNIHWDGLPFFEDGVLANGTVVSGMHTATLTLSNVNPADFPYPIYLLFCRVNSSCEQGASPYFFFSPSGILMSQQP